jgi:preprotein translocase subunit SecF
MKEITIKLTDREYYQYVKKGQSEYYIRTILVCYYVIMVLVPLYLYTAKDRTRNNKWNY